MSVIEDKCEIRIKYITLNKNIPLFHSTLKKVKNSDKKLLKRIKEFYFESPEDTHKWYSYLFLNEGEVLHTNEKPVYCTLSSNISKKIWVSDHGVREANIILQFKPKQELILCDFREILNKNEKCINEYCVDDKCVNGDCCKYISYLDQMFFAIRDVCDIKFDGYIFNEDMDAIKIIDPKYSLDDKYISIDPNYINDMLDNVLLNEQIDIYIKYLINEKLINISKNKFNKCFNIQKLIFENERNERQQYLNKCTENEYLLKIDYL